MTNLGAQGTNTPPSTTQDLCCLCHLACPSQIQTLTHSYLWKATQPLSTHASNMPWLAWRRENSKGRLMVLPKSRRQRQMALLFQTLQTPYGMHPISVPLHPAHSIRNVCMRQWSAQQPGGQGLAANFELWGIDHQRKRGNVNS